MSILQGSLDREGLGPVSWWRWIHSQLLFIFKIKLRRYQSFLFLLQ